MDKTTKAILLGIVMAILLLLIAVSASSCKTIQPTIITRDSVRVEYKLDSVYIYNHDSVFVDRWRSNDTIYITTEKWLTRYKDKIVIQHDTINSIQHEEIVITEKVTPKWAWWSLIACIVMIAGIVIRVLIRIYLHR